MRNTRAFRIAGVACACLALGACANGRGIFLAGPGATPAPGSPEEDDSLPPTADPSVLAASGTAWLAGSGNPAHDLLPAGVTGPGATPSSGVANLATGALTGVRVAQALPLGQVNTTTASTQLLVNLSGVAARVTPPAPLPPLLPPTPGLPGSQSVQQLLNSITAPPGGPPRPLCGLVPCPGGG